jgi:hypothetical protein
MIRWLLLVILLTACGSDVPVSKLSLDVDQVGNSVHEWSAIVADGGAAADVYFNLGHAYYAQGDFASAASYWRVSHELSPRNGAISHNLALARTELGDAAEPVPPLVPWAELVTADELGVLGLLVVVVGLVAIGYRRRRWALGLVLGGLILGLRAGQVRSMYGSQPTGVAVTDGLQLRELPRLDARHLGAVGRGSELRILRVHESFALVVDGKERRGWVPMERLRAPLGP